MKIRTEQQLFDNIDQEMSWRKTDLIRLRKAIIDIEKSNELLYKTLLRSSIPLLYAHWEGFIKQASIFYINYISLRKLPYNVLNKGVLAKFIQTEFLSKSSNNDFEKGIALINFFENQLNERSNLKGIPDPINTKANLSSSVLKEIIEFLDLSYLEFSPFAVFIDLRLLEARNKIAHGEYREVDRKFYDEAHEIVIRLITEYKDQIQNNVVLKKYYRNNIIEVPK